MSDVVVFRETSQGILHEISSKPLLSTGTVQLHVQLDGISYVSSGLETRISLLRLFLDMCPIL